MNLLIACTLLGTSPATDIEALGHIKSFAFGTHERQSDTNAITSAHTARLQLEAWRDDVQAFAAYGVAIQTGYGVLAALTAPPQTQLRIDDISARATSGPGYVAIQNLDRLGFAFDIHRARVRVGRQAIAHGNARLFPTTDIFAPYSFAALDAEYKIGVDALRVTLPWGEAGEFEVYSIANRQEVTQGMHLARGRYSFSGGDLSVYAGMAYEAPVLGIDATRDILGATLYAETFVRHWQDDTWTEQSPTSTVGWDLRSTLGAHRQFGAHFSVIAEIFYNGTGAAKRGGYFKAAARPAALLGETFLLGRWYAGLAASYQLTDLLTVSGNSIVNLIDGSAVFLPGLEYSFEQNTVLRAGMVAGAGPTGLDARGLRSELGTIPVIGFGALQINY